MWHNQDECQICDAFEVLWHDGFEIAPDEHDIVPYPFPDPEPVRGYDGEPICTCTFFTRCPKCISDGGSDSGS